MDHYDRLLIGLTVLAILFAVMSCERTDSARGQQANFVPRMLVGDGLWMWDRGAGQDRCYTTSGSGASPISCVPAIPTRAVE